MAKHATVDDYIAAPGLPAVAGDCYRSMPATGAALPEAQAATRRASAWSTGTAPICCLKAASRRLTSGFWGGARIHDPARRLETGGQVMRPQSTA